MARISDRRPNVRSRWKRRGNGKGLGTLRNRLGNGVDGEIRLFFVDHQRRREANGRSTGAENQQSAPEAFIEDRVTKLARSQFNANHRPRPRTSMIAGCRSFRRSSFARKYSPSFAEFATYFSSRSRTVSNAAAKHTGFPPNVDA